MLSSLFPRKSSCQNPASADSGYNISVTVADAEPSEAIEPSEVVELELPRDSIEATRPSLDLSIEAVYVNDCHGDLQAAIAAPPARHEGRCTIAECLHFYIYSDRKLNYDGYITWKTRSFLRDTKRLCLEVYEDPSSRERLTECVGERLRVYHSGAFLYRLYTNSEHDLRATIDALEAEVKRFKKLELKLKYADYLKENLSDAKKNFRESIPKDRKPDAYENLALQLIRAPYWTDVDNDLDKEHEQRQAYKLGHTSEDRPAPMTDSLMYISGRLNIRYTVLRGWVRLYAERNELCHNMTHEMVAKQEWSKLAKQFRDDKDTLKSNVFEGDDENRSLLSDAIDQAAKKYFITFGEGNDEVVLSDHAIELKRKAAFDAAYVKWESLGMEATLDNLRVTWILEGWNGEHLSKLMDSANCRAKAKAKAEAEAQKCILTEQEKNKARRKEAATEGDNRD